MSQNSNSWEKKTVLLCSEADIVQLPKWTQCKESMRMQRKKVHIERIATYRNNMSNSQWNYRGFWRSHSFSSNAFRSHLHSYIHGLQNNSKTHQALSLYVIVQYRFRLSISFICCICLYIKIFYRTERESENEKKGRKLLLQYPTIKSVLF